MKRDPLIGKKLANFRVDKPLGQGGMATVYYGIDTQLERPVALKIINPMYQGEPEFAKRFVDEAKIVARWRHEHIISVYYAGEEDDIYYFVMEYIDGATLEELLTRYLQDGELMPHEDVLRVGRAVASALDYAHQQGVVHRDIKPSNVMISRDDRVVLTDFGLALDMVQGSMGQVFGTPHYIAPEQARKSADATPLSDVYSFGVVLYEMLTGAIPFDDASATAIAVQHMTQAPPLPTMLNPALNQAVEDVLMKALSKDPSERYQSASDLIEALADAIASLESDSAQSPVIMPPAAVSGASGNPRLSRMSISDMLELDIAEDDIPTAASNRAEKPIHKQATREARAAQVTEASRQNRTAEVSQLRTQAHPRPEEVEEQQNSGNRLLMAGIILFVILGVIAVTLFALNLGDNTPSASETTSATEAEAIVTADDNFGATTEATELIVTATAQANASGTAQVETEISFISAPSSTATPDSEATVAAINATNDAIATSNAQSQATNDAVATSNAQAQSQATNDAIATSNAQQIATLTAQAISNAEPTVVFPNGRLVEMTYNAGGFYLRNSSNSTMRDSRFGFQAINSAGNAVSSLFDGGEWARFYGNIDSNGRCVAIELLDQTSWTRPNDCVQASGSNSRFNSLLTFADDDDRVFWQSVNGNGAMQFIVFWDDAEIARCDIMDGFCQVRVGE